jgi:hypothetical protein
MQEFVLVNGYGVPKDIIKDDNYRHYLNAVFNTVYEACVRDNIQPIIIFSGGKTDMFKPYRRTEAGEMAKYFKLLAKRPFVAKVTKTWKCELESRALSSLENMLFARELLKKKYPRVQSGTVVFEHTRTKRIHAVGKKVFAGFKELTFLPVDFDVSKVRYDLQLVDDKEAYALKMDLWSLESPKNLKLHHEVFADKVKTLRQAGPEHHQEALHAWWRKSLERLEKMKG